MTDKISEEYKKIMEDKISLGRFGKPDDVANVVAFLSSELSDYITVKLYMLMGACILVDKVIEILINEFN